VVLTSPLWSCRCSVAISCPALPLLQLVLFWQFWLGFLILSIPDTWFSGVTMTWIFLHNIAEFSFFTLKWALLDGVDDVIYGQVTCSACGDCCAKGKCCECCGSCCTLSKIVGVLAGYFTFATIIMMLTDNVPLTAALASDCARAV
jgi:hypothetical protein